MHESQDEKVEVVEGVEHRYSTDWIHKLETEKHWRLYWQQQNLMQGLLGPGDRVLEIGVGSGFTANYLRSKGVSVTTLDIDEGKQPDIVANITLYDFPDRYDAVLAFEIFEHIPYEQFLSALPHVAAAAGRHLFLSVPRNRRLVAMFRLKLPKLKARGAELRMKRGRIDDPHHFWEVDHGDVTVESLERDLGGAGLTVHRRREALGRLFWALDSAREAV